MIALTPEEQRLRAWAGCVRRLMAVAPTSAVMGETGVTGGHSTPTDRRAIREAALVVVDGWLERDLTTLDAATARETALRGALERIASGHPLDDGTDLREWVEWAQTDAYAALEGAGHE